jgi:hypothetical protein
MIHYRSITSVIAETDVGCEEREKQTIKRKIDEDESPDGVILPVKVVRKEDIGLLFFPQHPRDNFRPPPPADAPKLHHKASSSC